MLNWMYFHDTINCVLTICRPYVVMLARNLSYMLSRIEILMDLWKIKESTQYYERAIALEPSLEESLAPVLKRLRQRQKLLEQARSNGWPEDTLRLALDVAAR